MAQLLWLPGVLRGAGLTVFEVSGWQTRTGDDFDSYDPRGLIIHETRGSKTSTVAGEIGVLLNGSNTAPAPISQLFLARNGDWHVVAAGVCWHALQGRAGNLKGLGNYQLIGIEAQHAGDESWTDVQYRSYVRGVAAICRHLSWGVDRISGHKEHQPGEKTDPLFDMTGFRADVAAVLSGGDDEMSAAAEQAIFQMRQMIDDIYTGNNQPKNVATALQRTTVAKLDALATVVQALTADGKIDNAKAEQILTEIKQIGAPTDAQILAQATHIAQALKNDDGNPVTEAHLAATTEAVKRALREGVGAPSES